MHGPIGFQPYWLRKQGYAGKNLLQLIADECFKKGITITAITSQADEIIPRSVQDRLFCLREYEAPLMPRDYNVDSVGQNILRVEKDGQRVYLVNGQTVMPEEDGKRFDLLVVGSNQVPNSMNFRDTLKYCSDKGLTRIAEHPLVESHRGMGRQRLEKYIEQFDAVEGFNAQAIFPRALTRIPIVGSGFFSRAGRESNEEAKKVAREYEKPYVANSDAHRIKDLGISNIEWAGKVDDRSEEGFLADLKERVSSGRFKTVEKYMNVVGWCKWVTTFQRGLKQKIEEAYIPSNELRLCVKTNYYLYRIWIS